LLQNSWPGCTAVPHPSQNMRPPQTGLEKRSRDELSLRFRKKKSREANHPLEDTQNSLRGSLTSHRVYPDRSHAKIFPPGKRKGHPATWAAFSSRENSSNGGLQNSVKTFWRNLMSRKTGVSREFSEINVFVFSYLQSQSLRPPGVPF